VDALLPAAQRVLAEVNEQVAQSPESMSVVANLEAQFDAITGGPDRHPMAALDIEALPTGDEIAAEFEAYLAEQDGPAEG
jgi:hypothetical protein